MNTSIKSCDLGTGKNFMNRKENTQTRFLFLSRKEIRQRSIEETPGNKKFKHTQVQDRERCSGKNNPAHNLISKFEVAEV